MYYIFTVGLSLSGKTWLVKKIKERFPRQFEVIETRAIHDYLNTMDLFKDNNTIEGEMFKLRQEATSVIRKSLVQVFSKKGINLIQDSCNLVLKDRQERLKAVKKVEPKIKSVLIYVNSDRKEIVRRSKNEDHKIIKKRYKAAWYDLYLKQIEHFEKPTRGEADHFIEYNGKDWQSVIKNLENIMRP